MGKVYTLSQNQMKVLLLGRGYDTLMTLGYEMSELDNATVLKTLNELTKKGVLSARGDSFVLESELLEMMDTIGNANCCVTVVSRQGQLPNKCLFVGEKLLSCTIRAEDSNHIAFAFASIQDFLRSLFEEGYLPEKECELMPTESEAELFEQNIPTLSPGGTLKENSPVVLKVDVICRESAYLHSFMVVDYYIGEYILYTSREHSERALYNPDNIKEYLMKLVQDDCC